MTNVVRGRGRTRRAGIVLLLMTLTVVAWTFAGVATSPDVRSSTLVGSAAVQLAGAERSLAAGSGPAAGKALSCVAAGSLSVRCGDSSSLYPANPSVAGWTNVTNLVRPNPGTWIEGAMTWDASDGYVLLWGGIFGAATRVNETWTYANGAWTNVTYFVTGGHPPGLALLGLAYDPSTQAVIEFGGALYGGGASGATWSYHNLAWNNISTTAGPGPSPRAFHGMSEDSTDQEVVLFGGETVASSNMNDTWILKNGHWTNITGTAGFPTPGISLYPLLTDDPAISGALLFVLTKKPGLGYVGGTYEFRAGVWTNLTATLAAAPPPSELGTLNWFGQGSGVAYTAEYIFNRSGVGHSYSVSWVFSQGVWLNLSSQLVPAASVFVAGASLGDGSVLVYGGLDHLVTRINWTYILSVPPAARALTAVPAATDLGMPVNFSAASQDGIAPLSSNLTWGDGTSVSGLTRTVHAYLRTGTFLANYTVTDWVGRSSTASAAVAVNPDVAVVAVAASALTAPTGTNVLLAATVTGGTGPDSYVWSFGDGTTSTAVAPTHQWSRGGTFTVAVTVTDAVGGHASKSVTETTVAFSWTSGTGLIGLVTLVAAGVAVVSVVGTILYLRRRRGSGGTGGSPTAWSLPAGAAVAPSPGPEAPPPPPAGGPPPGAS